MKNVFVWVAAGSSLVLGFALVHGCAFNPFNPPDIEDRPGQTTGSSGSGCTCDGKDDGNECTKNVGGACPDGDENKCHVPDVAKPCSAGPNFICNLEGKCESDCLTCTNEPECTARCNAQVCPDDAGCKSGHCQQGVCCASVCDGPCKSCNREGMIGTCQILPFSMQVPGCDTVAGTNVSVCNGAGSCTTVVSMDRVPLGAGCNDGSSCISGSCNPAAGCVSDLGGVCAADLECGSNLCDKTSHVCKLCTSAADCQAGANCVMGVCQVFPGEQADNSSLCAQGTESLKMCALEANAPCVAPEQCKSRNCNKGVCTNFCTQDGDCLSGACHIEPMESFGYCKLPKDARCVPGSVQAWACLSGKCSGFPPRCE